MSCHHAHGITFKNWGLKNEATQIEKSWKMTKGSPDVVVAVIDTGVDLDHPDLKDQILKKGTQTHGFDFVTKKNEPKDEHGHGTHIAGIIAGKTNLKIGASGVAPSIKIMPVRYYSEKASGAINVANTIKSLHFAIDNGAKIINYSGGGPEFSKEEFEAMRKAEEKGVLIVAAAGNDHRNTDQLENRYYPAAYALKGLKNIITVASLDENGRLLPSSNWGVRSVDVAAPGEGIFSTLPKGQYGKMSGTSQATAFVSGLAALLKSRHPSLTPEQMKELIVRNVDQLKSLGGRIASGGKINAEKTLRALDLSLSLSRSTASKSAPQ